MFGRNGEGVVARIRALASERYAARTGREPSAATEQSSGPTPTSLKVKGGVVEPPERILRRPRRLPDPAVEDAATLEGLLEAVDVRPATDRDPVQHAGYDHSVWLEEWLELAVGEDVFTRLEEAVSNHPDVVAAMHEDRETFYVAAPTLHPDDVRAVIINALADDFDPDWEAGL